MNTLGEELAPRKKEQAIIALLTHRNVEEAAKAVGIWTRKLFRWQKEPDFKLEYRRARHTAYRQSIARIQQGSSAAASTLIKLLVDPTTPASTRARAAEIILNQSTKSIEIEDLDARVEELERSAEESKPDSKPEQRRRWGRP